jgi:hypothetical protein
MIPVQSISAVTTFFHILVMWLLGGTYGTFFGKCFSIISVEHLGGPEGVGLDLVLYRHPWWKVHPKIVSLLPAIP